MKLKPKSQKKAITDDRMATLQLTSFRFPLPIPRCGRDKSSLILERRVTPAESIHLTKWTDLDFYFIFTFSRFLGRENFSILRNTLPSHLLRQMSVPCG
ncbi:hypothetical protein CEXT_211201 [Caerostris extrusa]|uniref:Uncharacterized protein n=1 Tax=Caerostris extrusa TaxID=172846 RepID=A0AAV4NBG0_CAEEX|nr:hypothetical protein CEXT_211201 [Caerostris extrusa]